MRRLFGNFDGACEPKNPGGRATCGWLWKDESGVILAQAPVDKGTKTTNTNNFAEYWAALYALQWLYKARADSDPAWVCELRGDSQLVVRQVSGEYACNSAALRDLRDAVRRGIKKLDARGCSVVLRWVPREENAEADALSKSLYSAAERAEIARVEAWRKSQKRR